MLLTQKGPEFPLVFCWADSRIWHMPRQPVKDNQDVVQICKQWVCCAFPSTQSWTHRRKQRRHTTEKGWNKKAKKKKKRQRGKKERKKWAMKQFLLLFSRYVRPLYCNPVDGSLTGFSVHGILQARILELAAFLFPVDLPGRDPTCIYCIGRQILYHCPTWEAWSMKGKKRNQHQLFLNNHRSHT